MRLPARRMLNVVWNWAIMRIDPKDREEWRLNMNKPIPLLSYSIAPDGTPAPKPGPTVEELQADRDAWLAAARG